MIQPTPGLVFTISGHAINPSDIVGPIIITLTQDKVKNLMCLYACFRDDHVYFDGKSLILNNPSESGLISFRKHVMIPNQCLDMGGFVVLIHTIPKFLERIEQHAKARKFGLRGDRVNYFDQKSHNGKFDEPLFNKKNAFSWQSEYRLVLDRGATKADPYRMELGSLKDVCSIENPTKLNSTFKITAERRNLLS